MSLHRYAVGELYHPGRTDWPERSDLALGPLGAELRLFFADPTRGEVDAVLGGTAQFAWLAGDHGAMLCYELDPGIPWGDVSYHVGRERRPDAAGELPPGAACTILLVDAATGILRAIRRVGWPANACAAIRATIARQRERGLNAQAEVQWLEQLYRRYPDTAEMVRDRADLTWEGGSLDDAQPGSGPDSGAPEKPPAPPGRTNPIVAEVLGPYLVPDRSYPTPLPAELEPWYCYTSDGGHNIVVVLESHLAPGVDRRDLLVPAPVRAVVRTGWRVEDGYVICNLPYDRELGLITEPDDDEI